MYLQKYISPLDVIGKYEKTISLKTEILSRGIFMIQTINYG